MSEEAPVSDDDPPEYNVVEAVRILRETYRSFLVWTIDDALLLRYLTLRELKAALRELGEEP